MANSKLLSELRAHLTKLENDYNALSQAYNLIASAEGVSGKALKLSGLKGILSGGTVKTGKRGRPRLEAPVTGRVRVGSNIDPKTGKRRRVTGLTTAIQEALKKHGKLMTNSELTNKLASSYPAKTKPELSRYLSIILSNMKAEGIINSHKFDKQGKPTRHGYWGLANWFDGHKPKSNYMN